MGKGDLMDGQVDWWMYLLSAFTPVVMLLTLGSLKANAEQKNSTNKADKGITAPDISPLGVSITTALTQVVLGGMLYALWLGGHGLVFWLIDKPLHISAYFYKPPLVAYWFPYLFGLFFIIYRVLIAPKISQMRIKTIMHGLISLGFVAACYMVMITYLKWLAI